MGFRASMRKGHCLRKGAAPTLSGVNCNEKSAACHRIPGIMILNRFCCHECVIVVSSERMLQKIILYDEISSGSLSHLLFHHWFVNPIIA